MNTTTTGDAMIHKTPFAGMYNVSRADGVEFGHVTDRLADGWTAYTWVEDGDIQVGGVFATMNEAVDALLSPTTQLAPWELELLNPGEYYDQTTYVCVGCGGTVLSSDQATHMNTEHPKWPTADPDSDESTDPREEAALDAFVASMEDSSNQGAMSGDLEEIVSEARGWLRDCGSMIGSTMSPRYVLTYVEARYDGGLAEFVTNIWPVVTPSRIAV